MIRCRLQRPRSTWLGGWSAAFLSVQVQTLFQLLYVAVILVNFLGCIWYYTAVREGLDNSWLVAVGMYLSSTSLPGPTLPCQRHECTVSREGMWCQGAAALALAETGKSICGALLQSD